MKQVQITVISNEQLWGEHCVHGHRKYLGAWLMWLKCPEVASEARPGHFIMVNCGEESTLPRPFSIHQVNDEGDISLFYAVSENGKGTSWLSRRHIGDTVDLLGPLGNGFPIYPASQNLLLIAGGIGIAPLLFLAQEARHRGCSVTLLLGASTTTQLYPGRLLPSEAKLVITTEDGTAGKKDMITDLLPEYIDWADQIFACGPMPMYRDIMDKYRHLLEKKSVQISLEVRMACGLGTCYGCTVKTKNGLRQVCKDGPVFNLDDILWDEISY